MAGCGQSSAPAETTAAATDAPAEDTTASSDETKETSAGAKDALKGVKLKFGTTALFAPFTYYDTDGTTLIGFDIDMMNALKDYLGFDKIICCGGSWMVKADLIKNGEFEKICNLTKEAKELAKSIRQ